VHETPTLTREKYEEVVRRLTNGKSHIETPSDLPFDGGLLVHVAGEGPNGFHVFDVFESEGAVERFRAAMGTIPEEVGIEEPPKFLPAHTVYVADAGGTHDAQAARTPHCFLEQRRLPDARLAEEDKRAAASAPNGGEQCADLTQFLPPTDEHRTPIVLQAGRMNTYGVESISLGAVKAT
jgi:hypothetical protein